MCELDDAVAVVVVVVEVAVVVVPNVAVEVSVAAVVGREEKKEPSLSVYVVECRWIELPLIDSRWRVFSKCRCYRHGDGGNR